MREMLLITGVLCACSFSVCAGDEELDQVAQFLGAQPAELGAQPGDLPKLIFQTNGGYDPQIDLACDAVMVHLHGESLEKTGKAMGSWREQGYPVLRMFFASSDAGQHYEQGRADGTPHPGEQETTADGTVLRCVNTRAYTLPTEGWREYIATFVDHAMAEGAVGIIPEEPFGHAAAGYSPAFKQIWEKRMGTPWSPPHANPTSFWQAARLKSDYFYELVDYLGQRARSAAAERDQPPLMLLPIHSILSNLSGGRIFPNVRSIGLADYQGWIGQVWTGPVRWALGQLDGEHYEGFFESALALYGTFDELARNTDKTMYFLVDPVEDDPSFSWTQYRLSWQRCLAAMLMYSDVDHYEVMPWPDRIFLPWNRMASGTPGPADYLTQLLAGIAVMNDMQPDAEAFTPNDQGIGLLLADTISWEHPGPDSTGMAPFHGLYLPLATRGILVRLPWLERAAEPGYLDNCRLLLLSYAMQKPASAEIHAGLVNWVRAGGQLVIFDDDSAYNAVPGWWQAAGHQRAVDHLLAALELDARGGVDHASGPIEIDGQRLMCNAPWRAYTLPAGAEPLMRGADGAVGAFSLPIGQGRVTLVGLPAHWATLPGDGNAGMRSLLGLCAEKSGLALKDLPAFEIRRCGYRAGWVLDGATTTLAGRFVDVFDPSLAVVENPGKAGGQPFLLREAPLSEDREEPELLFATHRLVWQATGEKQLRVFVRGPVNTLGAMRVTSPKGQLNISDAMAIDAQGQPVNVLHWWDPDTRTSLVQFENHPTGVALRLEW